MIATAGVIANTVFLGSLIFTIRKLFEGRPLVPGVKALLAHIHGDPEWARLKPPLVSLSAADKAAVVSGYDVIRNRAENRTASLAAVASH